MGTQLNQLLPAQIPETGPGGRPIHEEQWMRSPESIDFWRQHLVNSGSHTAEQAAAEFPYDPTWVAPTGPGGRPLTYEERIRESTKYYPPASMLNQLLQGRP